MGKRGRRVAMLDLLVSLHQELERDEMANTSADGLVCKVERDVLASRNVILHGCRKSRERLAAVANAP